VEKLNERKLHLDWARRTPSSVPLRGMFIHDWWRIQQRND
jgi:hypothetical protein